MSSLPPKSPLPPTSQTLIKIPSITRIATCLACLIAPRFTCAQQYNSLPFEHTFAIRMTNVREDVNGGLLVGVDVGSKRQSYNIDSTNMG
jgi:hypothetical protein